MKEFSSYLVLMFTILFWILRVVVSLTNAMYMDFPIKPMDANLEIILLFVALACIVLIAKRKTIGAMFYLVIYGIYFGTDLFNYVGRMSEGSLTLDEYTNMFVSLIGLILPFIVLFELLIDKNRTKNPIDKKTDWFYKNKDYDRQLDERADKNNYKTL